MLYVSLLGEFYVIKPKPSAHYFQWSQPTALNGMKFSSLASAFGCSAARFRLVGDFAVPGLFLKLGSSYMFLLKHQALENSRLLSRAWRVAFIKESKDS